jgi:uncharacterized protein with FMN-binding domain
MKIIRLIGIVLIILFIGIFISYQWIDHNLKQLLIEDVDTIDLNQIDDGVYTGKSSTFPIEVEVLVEVTNHIITNIDVIKHINGQGSEAINIVDRVIEQNSVDVDVISGASYSSHVILNAISDALRK